MKTKIDRMKHRAKSTSKRTLALLMSLVMLVTAVGVSTMMTAFAVSINPTEDALSETVAPADESVAPDDFEENPFLKDIKGELAGTGAVGEIAATGDTTYYLYHDTDDNVPSGGTSDGALSSNGDGTYTGSFSFSSGNNFYASISTSSSLANAYTNNVITSSTSVTLSGNVATSNANPVNRQSTYVLFGYLNTSGTHTIYVTYDPTGSGSVTVTTVAPAGGGGGGGGGGEATVSGGTAVSNAELLAVLRNQKIMYYGGELISWNQSTFYAMTENNTSKASDSGTMTGTYNIDGNTEFTDLCTADDDMYMGHWNSGLKTTPAAGKAYIVRGSAGTPTSGTLTQKDNSGGNYLYEYTNGETTTATTTCSADINIEQKLTVSTSTAAGTSVLGATNSFKYYITAGNTITSSSTFNEFTITDGKIDTSAFTAGTYTLVTVLNDGTISVVADTDTFTVSLIPLATPTITLDTATGSNTSTQTASLTDTSTVTVTNTTDYSEGTIFNLYKGSTLVNSNTTGSFTVARNSTTAGVYKVVAAPGASDTTHTNSADSNKPTLAISKITIASVPAITIDKSEVEKDEKIKLTVTNANLFDSDLYDLVVYKNKDGNASATAPFSVVGTVMTSSTYINVATSDAVTAGSNDHAHYYVVAEAKYDTIYENSDYSNVGTVWIQIARYWFTGDLSSNGAWATGSSNNAAADQYFGNNTFYHKFSSVSGAKYFRIVSSSTQYGNGAAADGTDTDASGYTSSTNMYTTTAGDHGALYFTFDSSDVYYLFVHQRVSDTPQFYYRKNLAEVTVTPKYLEMNHTTGAYKTAATDTTGEYLYTPTDFTLVDSGSTQTLTAELTNSDYEFVGWFDDDSDFDAAPLSTSLTYAPTITESKTFYPVVREKVTRHNVTVKSNNARLGTGSAPATPIEGQTVTVTVSPNTGDFSSITAKDASNNDVELTTVTAGSSYTFTMPTSDVTVNLTFAEASGTSNFYYNGYDTSGQPLSGFFGQQMSLAKVGGQEYSYYHVEGRSGLDHLFTVSYGNIDYSDTYVYFQVPDDWDDKTWWEGNNQYAYFMTSDEVMVQDWTKMTADGTKNSKHQYKIAVPDGARYVFFKEGKTGGAGDPQTVKIDLNTSENGNCNAWYLSTGTTDGKYNVTGFHNDDYLNTVGNVYENFNGTSKYTSNFSTGGFNNHNATRGGSHSYSKPNNFGTSSGDYYIIVLYSGQEYTINDVTRTVSTDPEIIWMPKLPGTEDVDSSDVHVYAKDGSVVINWNNKGSAGASDTSGTAYGFGVIADTHIYDSDGTTSIGTAHTHNGNDYESATIPVTSEDSADIVIKTTIDSDYTSKYYLKGWCINGETYACGTNVKGVNDDTAGEASGSDRVYTMTYTIPAGSEDDSKIEITPIYYLKPTYISDNSLEMVTFYLEGYNTISSKWGDTPYIYPFYGNLNNVDNSFGVYPGQPMVYANGQYSIEIPVNKNVPIVKTTSNIAVKGITISNGYADHVHRNQVYKWTDHDNDADHKQTYDFDDFYKIYEECLKNGSEHPNAIFFRIQDEETIFNRSAYGGGKSGQFASGTDNITISDISSSGNGWELLVNRYNQPVNIFGSSTGITAPAANVDPENDTENALYVVSTGYNANIAGDYGTMWKIYNGSGQLISSGGGRYGIPPSVLLLRGNSSGYTTDITYPSADRSVDGVGSYKDSIDDYETIYKALQDAAYTGKRVYITYEKDAQDTRKVTSGTGAFRLDGRWYYTHKSDDVSSTMSIQFWDDSTGAWVDDSGQSGSATLGGCDANFTDTGASGKTSGTHTIQNSENFTFTATPGAGWQFDSWQIKYSDTSYDQISTTASSSMPATASYHIVARFVKTSAGDLTITHTLNSNSTGEGTVDMAVNVYTDSSMTTLVTGFTEKTGTRVYLDSTYINNSTAANYYIKVQLKATPQYDGKVTAFGYDSFNSSKSIIATTDPADLADAAENTLTTSTFSFPVSDLYNVSTQKTDTLNYTSLIADTPHYYNFTYQFTSRGSATVNDKTYTSKGVMDLTEYKKYVTDQAKHELSNTILVTMAPFESNFLKKNELDPGEISWNGTTHTYSATSEFNQQNDVPNYHVIFDLPYSYYSAANSTLTPPVKEYTVQPTNDVKEYDTSTPTFDLLATYNTFVTVGATSSTVGSQSNVSKVTDGSDVNHTGNDFITAPDELMDGETTMYFKYWKVSKLNSDGTAGDLVTYLYYPDFHYRVYSDYYVEAVYSDKEEDFWKFNYSEDDNKAVDCSVLYLGDSRNQWNDGTAADGTSTNSAVTAADKLYSDFIFHYTYKGQELSGSENVEVGMILERATYMDGETEKWLTGSTSVNDMNYYRATYGGSTDKSTETARKNAISSGLSSGTLPSGTVKVTWDNGELNNKNFTEQNYSVFSQYGQTVANDTITFAKDNTIDNYVYRAYAYIYDPEENEYTLSDPVYFCMRYTSNLKYTE